MRRRRKEPGLDDVQEQVGVRLAAFRRRLGWTQEHAADQLGIGHRRLQQIEAGRVNLTLRSIVRFARVYGVGVVDLFAGDPAGSDPPSVDDC